MAGPSEVIVKIDRGDQFAVGDHNPELRRRNCSETSFHLWTEEDDNANQEAKSGFIEDQTPKLIEKFLNKKKSTVEDLFLDVDLEMGEQRSEITNPQSPIPNFPHKNQCVRNSSSYKELRVSSEDSNFRGNNVVDIEPDEQDISRQKSGSSSSSDEVFRNRRRSANVSVNEESHNHGGGNESQVLKCTSIQRMYSNLGRMKTKSRLLDQPEIPDKPLGKTISGQMRSGQLRSGILGRVSGILGKQQGEEDEDDPLFDDDLPDEYKEKKIGIITIIEWISLLLIVTALICTLVIKEVKRKKFRELSLWKWEVLVLVLICGGLVSEWGIKIVVFFIERNFLMRKRVLYFVYGVRKAMRNCIWLGLVLIAWRSMFDNQVDGRHMFLRYVNKVMVCMIVGTLLWLVKTLMVKILASSFHVSTFFDRIQESLFNQYVIEKLSGPALVEMKHQQEEEERTMAEVRRFEKAGATLPPELNRPPCYPGGGLPQRVPEKSVSSGQLNKNQDDQGVSIAKLQRVDHKNVSAWSMKRLMRIVKHGVLRTLDENVLDNSQGDETATQIRNEREAIAAARKIFRNVAKPRAKFIYVDDLLRFLEDVEALKTISIVEGSVESDKISKASLKIWVVNAFLERRALALTLNDTKTAVKKLHQVVNIIVGIVILIICLMILNIATGRFFIYLSSQIVIVAFIFGNTLKTIFESIIFVFVIHPFDVGDRCEVDDVQMVVEEMNILTTVFLRYDNQKIIFPNSTLSTRPISNFYRSPDMGDGVEFSVHIATPAEKIALMKQRIISYIESRSDHWYPEPAVVLMNLENLNMLKLSVWLRHRMNHQNMGEKWKRRALLVEEMVKIFKDLDIEYRLYPIDINVRAMPPQTTCRNPPAWSSPPGN